MTGAGMGAHWGRTVVLVRDYEEAIAFYRDGLGFEVLFDEPGEGGFRLLHLGTGGETGLWLMQVLPGDERLVGHQAGGHPLGVLYVDELDAALARLAALGTVPAQPPGADAGSRWAHVHDLYGNQIVLVQLFT
ncbi:VOC family protein [Microterricola pindariensis]|nr:VOC family protein [Microterricola pindariensis]